MKILVSGGLGFIGSNFIRYLLSKYNDVEVVNVDRIGWGANPANLKEVEKDRRYLFIKGDISDANVIDKLVIDADVIVNMAAETHVDRSIASPWPFIQSNAVGTFTLLEATRRLNDKALFVQVSTDEVYGDVPEGSFKENDGLKPSNPYSASKASADMFCLAYRRTYGLNVIITRCTNNFGPYQFPEKLIPKAIIRASIGLPIPIYGSGRNVRDWIYVLDHCEALDLTLKKGRKGEIYNVSAGNELANQELVKLILKLMGKPENLITFVEDRPGHDVRYSLNSEKIRTQLGWSPKHVFDDALRLTVDWYAANTWWWKPLLTEDILHPTPWRIKS